MIGEDVGLIGAGFTWQNRRAWLPSLIETTVHTSRSRLTSVIPSGTCMSAMNVAIADWESATGTPIIAPNASTTPTTTRAIFVFLVIMITSKVTVRCLILTQKARFLRAG
jgi:hypothetical protein